MQALAGRRILITRSRHQASSLASVLEALGATTVLIPTIEIVPPVSYAPLDEAIGDPGHFDWLVFTSANAVEAFRERSTEQDRQGWGHVRTAAIGPSTARAAERIGLKVSLIPPVAVAESLAKALLTSVSYGSKVLLVCASAARDYLPEALAAAGAVVTIVDAYRTLIPTASLAKLIEIFGDRQHYPDAVTFASSSTVLNLMTLLQAADLTLPTAIVRASIGPITSNTLLESGYPAHTEASEASIESLADALSRYLGPARST